MITLLVLCPDDNITHHKCQEKLPLLFPARGLEKNVVARLSLCLEEDVAANLGHEALADVATIILYNIFCAGCQAIFFCGGIFFGAIFLAGYFYSQGDFFGGVSEGGSHRIAT
jgi:hypothetical protein